MLEKSMKSIGSKELIDQFEELKERATKDALTGLLNRGTTEKYIKKRLDELEEGEACAMFIIDLDHFKTVNDTMGHQAGDQVIRRTAQILSGLFRARDIVGRLGGDEFVVFLCGKITEEVVRQKANSICSSLQLTVGDGMDITVSASVGICLSSGENRNFDDLYRMADSSLYEAKRSGRQRYYINMDVDKQFCQTDSSIPVTAVKLDRIVEFVDSGVALIETETPYKVLYTSASFRRMVGLSEEDTVCPLFTAFVFREDWEIFDGMIQKAKDGQEANESLRIQKSKDKCIWCRMRIKLADYDENVVAFMISLTDISDLKEEEHLLKKENENLQMALDQTGKEIWEVDFSTGIFRTHQDNTSFTVKGGMEFPEGLIAKGWILQESVPMFREFARELYDGKVSGYGNFALKSQDSGEYVWTGLSYNTIFDEYGQAVRAVGVIENMNQAVSEVKIKGVPQRNIPENLMPHLIVSLRVNLTRGVIEKVWSEGKYLADHSKWLDYDEVLNREKDRIIPKKAGEEFNRRFRREEMIAAYWAGERWFIDEYRRIDNSGKIHWVQAAINLYEDPSSHEVWVFVCLSNVEHRHRWEKSIGTEIERDPVTGLFSRKTTQDMVEYRMKQGGKESRAMALLNIAGLSSLYTDTAGNLEKKRFYIAAAFRMALGGSCILGQYSRDKLILFFPYMSSRDYLRECLRQAFEYVRSILGDTLSVDKLHFVAGAVWDSRRKKSYNQMLEEVLHLCDLWWNASSDKIAFSGEEVDWNWKEVQKSEKDDRLSLSMKKHQRPLTEKEKDVMLSCLEDFLMSDSLDQSVQSILGHLGRFYKADRTYILTLTEDGNMVTMPCEWTTEGKHSIQHTMSGMYIEKVPIIDRCMKEKVPVLLVRDMERPELEAATWRYAAFPMKNEDKIDSFLCIENASENMGESALVARLMPHIIRERKKYRSGWLGGHGMGNGHYDDLPNLRSYMEVIYDFNSDAYASMGAICLDVPDLPSMNSSMGFEYGSRFLWYISQTMGRIFGNTLLFRTWEAEFVALCPNANREVFLGRCNRLWALIQRRYPGKVRIGHTWSDGVFSGKALVEEARVIMRSEGISLGVAEGITILRQNTEFLARKAVQDGKIIIFLQPKVNMLTGALVGAEVLTRGIDTDGTVLLPESFLHDMEERGDVRELDLYMLDRTLFMMSQWEQESLHPIPLSINFSWVTLMDPAALASVLAIFSRYSNSCIGRLEFEVSAKGEEGFTKKKKDILEKFREHDIRFVLDDYIPGNDGAADWDLSLFSAVKFDMDFVAEMAGRETRKKQAKEFTKECRTEGITCIAEGVESRMQISELTQAGCFLGQGYYYDHPIPTEQFRKKYLYSVVEKRDTMG